MQWLGVLNSGGSAKVFKVQLAEGPEDNVTSQQLAVKVSEGSVTNAWGRFTDPCVAEALAQMPQGEAPPVLQVQDYLMSGDHAFVLTDFADTDLWDLVASWSGLGAHRPQLVTVRGIFRQMVLGIQRMHAAGLVHCDIKPQNIVLKSALEFKVFFIDFDFARFFDQEGKKLWRTSLSRRTHSFMGPETLESGVCGRANDIWAAGMSLLFMLFGQVPYVPNKDADPPQRRREALK
eukprot:CAMPEP_0198603552 /NCGR_PEP_ID=MMETSP1462-20131121/152118_1 /TAXON_ID=1333877 /ORGANISM="Brandtodinium nutriculum, Strain RCC3387" /LENGTH=233 /DNA_ID=CAMNT_0044335325 /DNA_START=42 /DNA_END=740 /DNA_ORIENTATION=+